MQPRNYVIWGTVNQGFQQFAPLFPLSPCQIFCEGFSPFFRIYSEIKDMVIFAGLLTGTVPYGKSELALIFFLVTDYVLIVTLFSG